MQKIVNISQFDGFGNLIPKYKGEYFHGVGASRGADGISFNKVISELQDADSVSVPIERYAYGKHRGYANDGFRNGLYYYLFMGCHNSSLYQSLTGYNNPVKMLDFKTITTSSGTDMLIDPKGRLIIGSTQYLAMLDNAVANDIAGTVTVTNGSNAVVGSGTSFTAGMVGKLFRVMGDANTYVIATRTDATHITLTTNFSGTTGSAKDYTVFTGLTEQWKDFGSTANNNIKMDVYESTVLVMRDNHICTLDVTTDTITTDASPSFSMPSGYIGKFLSVNKFGILMAWDSFDGSILTLWDNQSIRSISPWIKMKDRVIGMNKYNSGWIVITTRSVYYTDGYNLTILIDSFLDSDIYPILQIQGEVINNYYFFYLNGNNGSKQRDGLHRLNLQNGLVEYWGTYNDVKQYTGNCGQVYLIPTQNLIVFNDSYHHFQIGLEGTSTNRVYSYETSPILSGANKKIAKKVIVPLTYDSSYFSNAANSTGFKIECYLNNKKRTTKFSFSPSSSSTGSDYNKITFQASYYPTLKVGESVEFLSGNNAGQVRTITNITDPVAGVSVMTLDSNLAYLPSTGDYLEWNSYKKIGEYTIANDQPHELKPLTFTTKADISGYSFQIKFIVKNLGIPLTIMPFDFVYDDLGVM